MAYRVELTPRAIADADAAVVYLRQHAPERVTAWFAGLKDAILSLEELPRRCPLAPEARGLDVELRQLLYGKRAGQYRILYRVYDELDPPRVRVVAIRHTARAGLTPEEFAEII